MLDEELTTSVEQVGARHLALWPDRHLETRQFKAIGPLARS
jgi:hypothetical protein